MLAGIRRMSLIQFLADSYGETVMVILNLHEIVFESLCGREKAQELERVS